MKTAKIAVMLGTFLILIFCSYHITLAFNPQPEPPADSARKVNPDDKAMHTNNDTESQTSPAELPADRNYRAPINKPPDPVAPQIIPTGQSPGSDGKGSVKEDVPEDEVTPKQVLPGNQPMMEPLDHPPEPGMPQVKKVMPGSDKMVHPPEKGPIQPSMGQQSLPGSDKMQQDPEEEPIQALGTKMMNQGNGTPGGPKMIDPGDDGKPTLQGSPKMMDPTDDGGKLPAPKMMEDPGEGPTPGTKKLKKGMQQQMVR